jgi:hypothetical protein
MARYYYLLTIFSDEEFAKKCVSHFNQKEFSLTSGIVFKCKTDFLKTNSKLFCVFIEPDGVSISPKSGPIIKDSSQLDEVAYHLYESLKNISGFSCAIVGWEVADMFIPDIRCGYEDIFILPNEFNISNKEWWNGLVISEVLWEAINNNSLYEQFCAGYVWRPYKTLSISGW